MAKWAGIFLIVMIAAAIVGFVVDAVRVIAWGLFLVCAAGLAWSFLTKRRT
ncbi:MAG TPA: hypothetical protein VGB49_03225 [Caulobacteraceae bacterium]